jgi:hypothetical protein
MRWKAMTLQKEVKAAENTITSLDGSRTITVEEFDRIFDDGSDEIDEFVDWSTLKAVHPKARRVNVDFPPLMVMQLDAVAATRGIPRQALIKMWLADKLAEHARLTPHKDTP